MQPTTLGGPASVALNETSIPAEYLSEVTVELTGGERSRETLGGTFTTPSGTFDTAQAMFTMFLPNMDYLKNIFPTLYNLPSGTQTTGNIIFSTDTCVSISSPVNIHYDCFDNDNNDVYFYNGMIQLNFNPTYNQTDALTIEVTIFANPDEDGNIARLGTGDLTEPSIYDPETETTVPVSSS